MLVIAPYSALRGWAETLAGEGLGYYVAAEGLVCDRDTKATQARGWVLCPWQIVSRMPMTISTAWDAVVVDESRIISNPKANVTHAVLNIRARNHVVLSGAPVTEGMYEYYTQMWFLGESWGGLSFWDWRAKHFRQSVAVHGGRWYPTAAGERYVTATVARYAYQLRRADTPYALPAETSVRFVQLPEVPARQYRRVEKEFIREAADGTLDLTSWAGQRLVWMRRIADGVDENGDWTHGAKLVELHQLLSGPLAGKPVVVWAEYVSEIEAITQSPDGRVVFPIHGAISPAMREKRIELWSGTDDGILLCQPQCMRYGADLSHADTAVWFSAPASLDTWLQAQERTRKIGVHACTYTYVLVTEQTVDEDIWNALRDKDAEALRAGALVRAAATRKEQPQWWKCSSTPA